jgi:hypothetical protein
MREPTDEEGLSTGGGELHPILGGGAQAIYGLPRNRDPDQKSVRSRAAQTSSDH